MKLTQKQKMQSGKIWEGTGHTYLKTTFQQSPL